LDYTTILKIGNEHQAKAFIHNNNSKTGRLAIKVIGFIVAGALSPSLAMAFIQNNLTM